MPALLVVKIGFPFPGTLGTQTSSRWLDTSSAPVVEALAAGAWVAWCIAVVAQIRKHRMSVRSATLVADDDAALTADAVPIPTPLERLTEDASRCLTLVLEGPVQIDGPGARSLLPLVCAKWLRRNSSASILVDNSLEGDLKVIGPGARSAFTFAGGDRLLRLVEGEVLGRRRHALEMDLAEMEPSDELAPLLLIVADVAPYLRERWQALGDESAALGIGVLSVGTNLTAPELLTVTELLPPYLTPLAEIRQSATLAPVDGVDPPVEADFRPAGTSTSLAGVQAAIPVVQVHVPSFDQKPIRVQVLGPYRIWAYGKEVSTGLRSASRELLAWFLLQGVGASVGAAVDALWPDTEPDQVTKRFWRALGDLRSRLRSPNGLHTPAILVKAAGVYRADRDEIECDLWDFRCVVDVAASSGDEKAVRANLRQALATYQANLFVGTDFPWAIDATASLQRQAHDAAVRLADLEKRAGRLDSAVGVLEKAVAVDPHAEDLYEALIAVRLAMGDRTSARTVFDELVRHLHELGANPSERLQLIVENAGLLTT